MPEVLQSSTKYPQCVHYDEVTITRDERNQCIDDYKDRFDIDRSLAATLARYTYDLLVPLSIYNGKILDAGCKWGAFRVATDACNLPAETTNLDYVQSSNVDVVGNITSLPLAGNVFDVVVANWAIPDRIASYTPLNLIANEVRELLRVTRPGGKMIFSPLLVYSESLSQESNQVRATLFTIAREYLLSAQQRGQISKIKVTRVYELGFRDEQQNKDFGDVLEIEK